MVWSIAIESFKGCQKVVTPHLVLVPRLKFLAVLADHALIVFSNFCHSLVQVHRGRSIHGYIDLTAYLTPQQSHLLQGSKDNTSVSLHKNYYKKIIQFIICALYCIHSFNYVCVSVVCVGQGH